MAMTPAETLRALVAGRQLTEEAAGDLVRAMLAGEVPPAIVAGCLVALAVRGETTDEIVGAARAMRAASTPVPGVSAAAVDTCGTGGDGARTVNISTAAAIVVAGAGVPVAKHGNRAVSGTVGSADVLEALGVRLLTTPDALARCVREVGIAFLFAPSLHPAMRHVGPTRRELGVRTLFNLVGPLTNPAGVRRQVVGVPDARWVEPVAAALARLGTDHAWVVHGAGGLDELALDGESLVAEVVGLRVTPRRIRAAALGIAAAPISALQVGDAEASGAAIRAVLEGAPGPVRDAVVLNAAAGLVVSGTVSEIEAGVAAAARAVDDGRARSVLERLVAFTTRETA